MDLFRAANEGKTKANSLADSSQLSSSLLIIAYCLGVDHSLYLEFRVHCIYARGPERVVRPAPMQSHWKHINGESGFLPVALPLPLYPPACLSSCLFVLSQPTSFSLLFVFSLDQQYLDRFYFSTSEPTARLWAMCLRLCLCACVSAYRLSVCSLKSVQVLLRSLLVFRFYPSLLLSSALPLFIYLLSTLDTLLDARSLSLFLYLCLSVSLFFSFSLYLSLRLRLSVSLFTFPISFLFFSVPLIPTASVFPCLRIPRSIRSFVPPFGTPYPFYLRSPVPHLLPSVTTILEGLLCEGLSRSVDGQMGPVYDKKLLSTKRVTHVKVDDTQRTRQTQRTPETDTKKHQSRTDEGDRYRVAY